MPLLYPQQDKGGIRYCDTLPVIPRRREIDRVADFQARAPGPNICGRAVRAAGTHIALPAKRVEQDAPKGGLARRGQPKFSPRLYGKG